jgi:hypothetical protein
LRVAAIRSAVRRNIFVVQVPLLCAAALWGVLRWFASHDVREAPIYLTYYMVMGAAWVGLVQLILSFCGLSARDDAVERDNRAAGRAIGGALIGATFAFAGGNIGDGPGWWVVLFSAGLSTGALLLGWFLLNTATGIIETITVDRDPSSGWRAAGYFVGAGVILGRAVAGDWVSTEAAVVDFLKVGWPVAILWAGPVVAEILFKPTPHQPTRPAIAAGVVLAVAYVGFGVTVAILAGGWL